jgi:multiple sugar transport system substrate-binding protein
MFYSMLLHAFGGGYLDRDEYAFDPSESLAAVRFMRSTIENGLSPAALQNWEREEGRQRFVNGEGIFLWDNNDIVIWLDDPERSQFAGNWDLMPFPAQAGGRQVAATGGFAFGANPFSEKLDAAVQVLDVIGGEQDAESALESITEHANAIRN